MLKNGVYIIEHKKWNTKQIWNRGALMATYGHQPKEILFKSPMVNDFNQNLAGGWFMRDIEDPERETINRVIGGLKPMGVVHRESGTDATMLANEIRTRNDQSGRYEIDVAITDAIARAKKHGQKIYTTGRSLEIIVARHGTLKELFDLDSLYTDYVDALGEELGDVWLDDFDTELDKYETFYLIDFADGWDDPLVPYWVTGLILGYPIENTISVYLEEVR